MLLHESLGEKKEANARSVHRVLEDNSWKKQDRFSKRREGGQAGKGVGDRSPHTTRGLFLDPFQKGSRLRSWRRCRIILDGHVGQSASGQG